MTPTTHELTLHDLRLTALERRVKALEPGIPSDGSLYVIFDGPPGPEGGRFVEVETRAGRSVSVGSWEQRPDGSWSLGPVYASVAVKQRAEPDGLRENWRAVTGQPTYRELGAKVCDLEARDVQRVAQLKALTTERDGLRAERNALEQISSSRVAPLKAEVVRLNERCYQLQMGAAGEKTLGASREQTLRAERDQWKAQAEAHQHTSQQESARASRLHADWEAARKELTAVRNQSNQVVAPRRFVATHRHAGNGRLYRRVASVRMETRETPPHFAWMYDWVDGVLYEASDGTWHVRTAARFSERFEELP